HHTAFLRRHADPTVTITDVGPAHALLGVYGPESRSLLSGLGGGDLTSPYLDLGLAPALALPATRTGEQGWDLRVPAEYAQDLYDRISAAGAADLGHRALRTLRLEKHDPSWAAELTADDNPDEAGLPADPGKPDLLAGPALRRIRDEGVTRRLTWFATDADVVMHGGEVVHGGGASASVRGAGFGHTVGHTIFSAYLPADAPADVEVEVMGERHPAVRQAVPPYDPRGERLHG
ncbi:MAG: aminomethyl transferase family protein, partial [Nonomuraea sp.]|nr:aminomethyl transferase family protein [Nonomuraea sp.]